LNPEIAITGNLIAKHQVVFWLCEISDFDAALSIVFYHVLYYAVVISGVAERALLLNCLSGLNRSKLLFVF
jgi:hypothetical protein